MHEDYLSGRLKTIIEIVSEADKQLEQAQEGVETARMCLDSLLLMIPTLVHDTDTPQDFLTDKD